MTDTADVQQWNALAGEWQTMTVTVPDQPRQRKRGTLARSRRPGKPVDLASLSTKAPIPKWWEDTAFAPGTPLADTRTYIKPNTIRTNRPPVIAFTATIMPATSARWRDL